MKFVDVLCRATFATQVRVAVDESRQTRLAGQVDFSGSLRRLGAGGHLAYALAFHNNRGRPEHLPRQHVQKMAAMNRGERRGGSGCGCIGCRCDARARASQRSGECKNCGASSD